MSAQSTNTDKGSKVQAKNLTTDHKLQTKDDKWKRISYVGRGMYNAPSKMITLETGEWLNLLDTDLVDAIFDPIPETEVF